MLFHSAFPKLKKGYSKRNCAHARLVTKWGIMFVEEIIGWISNPLTILIIVIAIVILLILSCMWCCSQSKDKENSKNYKSHRYINNHGLKPTRQKIKQNLYKSHGNTKDHGARPKRQKFRGFRGGM